VRKANRGPTYPLNLKVCKNILQYLVDVYSMPNKILQQLKMMGIEETENDGNAPSNYDDAGMYGESKQEESEEEEDLRNFNEINMLDELNSQNIQHLDSDIDKDKFIEQDYIDVQFTADECPSNSPFPLKNQLSDSHYKNKSKVPPLDFSKIHQKPPVTATKADKKYPTNGPKMQSQIVHSSQKNNKHIHNILTKSHSVQKNESLNLSVISHNTVVKDGTLDSSIIDDYTNFNNEEVKISMKNNSKHHNFDSNEQNFQEDSLNNEGLKHIGTLNLDESSEDGGLKGISFLSEDNIPERENNFQTVENTEVEI